MPVLREDGVTEYSYEETKAMLAAKRYKYIFYTANEDLWFGTPPMSLKECSEIRERISKGDGFLWGVLFHDEPSSKDWILSARDIIAAQAIDVTPED